MNCVLNFYDQPNSCGCVTNQKLFSSTPANFLGWLSTFGSWLPPPPFLGGGGCNYATERTQCDMWHYEVSSYIHITAWYFSPTVLNERKFDLRQSRNAWYFMKNKIQKESAPVSLSHWHTYINLISAWTHAVSKFDWKQCQIGKL